MKIKIFIFILILISIFLIKISINNDREIIIYKYINDISKDNYISLKNKFEDMFNKKSPWVNSFSSNDNLKKNDIKKKNEILWNHSNYIDNI